MKDWMDIVDGTQETALEHGAIYDAVQEMAQKLGLGHIPVKVTESNYPMASAVANKNGRKHIRLNKGIIEATNSTSHGYASQELKAIIGHEFGHLSRDMFADIKRAKMPLYIMPAVAVAAYQGYKALHKTNNDDSPEKQNQEPIRRTWIGHLFGMNAQVASWGLVGGMVTAAMMSRSIEFGCDRTGAKLTSPQAMKDALDMIENHRVKIMPELKEKHPGAYWGQFFSLSALKEGFAEASYKAHPFKFERIWRLDKMAAKVSDIAHEGKIVQTIGRIL